MDDDSTKEENLASTSKKEEKQKEEEYDERDRDDRSYSESTASPYSGRSRLEIRADKETRPEQPKSSLVKPKQPERKKKTLRRGRVAKRRRSTVRRYQPVRRAIKKKAVIKREREGSVSTIFTRLSSRSSSNAPSCTFCGHRCCGRRYKERKQWRKPAVRKIIRKPKNAKQRASKAKKRPLLPRERKRKNVDKRNAANIVISEAIQIGSKSKMLSPLFVKTNAETNDQPESESPLFLKITPDMIYESLKRLTAWKSAVAQDVICGYMKRTYPVNPNKKELNNELTRKLRVAAAMGIAEAVQNRDKKYWCLTCELLQRGMTKNHVTLFWHLYGDTMGPVSRNMGQAQGVEDTEEVQDQPKTRLRASYDSSCYI